MKWGRSKDTGGKDTAGSDAATQNNTTPASTGSGFDPAAEMRNAMSQNAVSLPAANSAAGARAAQEKQQAHFAQLFSQSIAVLMRDANYKNLPLHELEFLLPPIMTGQCAIANAKAGAEGPFVPVAVALWARVSAPVDQRLSANLDKPVELKASEWTSGDIPWLITLAGSQQALPGFVKQLCEKQFKGQKVKMRGTDPSGKRLVQYLSAGPAPAA